MCVRRSNARIRSHGTGWSGHSALGPIASARDTKGPRAHRCVRAGGRCGVSRHGGRGATGIHRTLTASTSSAEAPTRTCHRPYSRVRDLNHAFHPLISLISSLTAATTASTTVTQRLPRNVTLATCCRTLCSGPSRPPMYSLFPPDKRSALARRGYMSPDLSVRYQWNQILDRCSFMRSVASMMCADGAATDQRSTKSDQR